MVFAYTNKIKKKTNLQSSFSYNQVALVDKVPTELNLKDCIKIYVDHNIECIVREAKFDKEISANTYVLWEDNTNVQLIKPNTKYSYKLFSASLSFRAIYLYDINKNFIGYSGVVNIAYVPENCYFIRFFMSKSNCSNLTITRQTYKPIQLNSLPNGVRDEIIMKPNSNKAQLVQRVGKVVLDGIYYRLSAYASEVKGDDISCTYSVLDNVAGGICQSDKLLNVSYSQDYKNIECIMLGTNSIVTSILKTRAYNAGEYAKENPITVYYELTTPIIHEIQLKGYPHVYEDGTVTLNTDIPHQTLVSYNVNQEQLISTQNETIIRHDQQIDDLYYYIEMYLEEIYQMELFRMKLELSL